MAERYLDILQLSSQILQISCQVPEWVQMNRASGIIRDIFRQKKSQKANCFPKAHLLLSIYASFPSSLNSVPVPLSP